MAAATPLIFSGIPFTCITGSATIWTASGLHTVAVYSGQALVEHFVYCGMTEDDAREYIDYNMIGAYVSDAQPLVHWEGDPEVVMEELQQP